MPEGIAYTRLPGVPAESLPEGWPASWPNPEDDVQVNIWPPGWPLPPERLGEGAPSVAVSTDATITVDQDVTVDVTITKSGGGAYAETEGHQLKIVFSIDGTGGGVTATFFKNVADVGGGGTQYGFNGALDPGISDLDGVDRTLTCTVSIVSVDGEPSGSDTSSVPALTLTLAGACSEDDHVLIVTADAPYDSYLLTLSNLSGDATGVIADNGTISPEITYAGTNAGTGYNVTFDVSAAAPP